jgi:hypothetical protein
MFQKAMSTDKPPHEDERRKKRKARLSKADYRKLSNEELHGLICAVNPEMSSYPVTEDTRETVIAMLEILHKG